MSDWEINTSGRPTVKNLKWVSDNVLRLYLSSSTEIKIGGITAPGTEGTFEITTDELNTLVKIKRLNSINNLR